MIDFVVGRKVDDVPFMNGCDETLAINTILILHISLFLLVEEKEFTWDGFQVFAQPDKGVLPVDADGWPTAGSGQLLNIRASQNGCSNAIEFQVVQNIKAVNGGIITTGDSISHVNVLWDECSAGCGKTTDQCSNVF